MRSVFFAIIFSILQLGSNALAGERAPRTACSNTANFFDSTNLTDKPLNRATVIGSRLLNENLPGVSMVCGHGGPDVYDPDFAKYSRALRQFMLNPRYDTTILQPCHSGAPLNWIRYRDAAIYGAELAKDIDVSRDFTVFLNSGVVDGLDDMPKIWQIDEVTGAKTLLPELERYKKFVIRADGTATGLLPITDEDLHTLTYGRRPPPPRRQLSSRIVAVRGTSSGSTITLPRALVAADVVTSAVGVYVRTLNYQSSNTKTVISPLGDAFVEELILRNPVAALASGMPRPTHTKYNSQNGTWTMNGAGQ